MLTSQKISEDCITMYFDDDLEIERLQSELSESYENEHRLPRRSQSATVFNKLSPRKLNKSSLSPSSLLCYSVVSRDSELLTRIVDAYPSVVNELSTEQGVSALHLAALDGNIDIIKLLISMNADVNLLDRNGNSVLDYAVQSGQFDASQYLIGCGSDMTRVRDGFVLL